MKDLEIKVTLDNQKLHDLYPDIEKPGRVVCGACDFLHYGTCSDLECILELSDMGESGIEPGPNCPRKGKYVFVEDDNA